MKKLSILAVILIGHIYKADAHWSDSYNGDYEEIGPVATIVGVIFLFILAGIFEEIDKKK
jgi:hypothetical protein